VGNTATCNDPISAPDLTFQDPPIRGAIVIHKTAKNHAAGTNAPLSGAVFQLLDGNGNAVGANQTTGTDGTACFSGLPTGTYTVHEVSAPSGYQKAADVGGVAVTSSGTCTSNPVAVPVVDVPLSAITVTFNSLAGPGVTQATSVRCDGTEKGPLDDGGSATYSNLPPSTYNCTIVIDP